MAEQTVSLLQGWELNIGSGRWGWLAAASAPLIDASLSPSGATRRLWLLTFNEATHGQPGLINLGITDETNPGTTDGANDDLSDLFEQDGQIVVGFGGTDYTFSLAGADTADPYAWTPSNSDDSAALATAIRVAGRLNRFGTLTLRDFTPGPPVFADDTGDPITGEHGVALADVVVPEAGGGPNNTYAVVGDLPAGVTFAEATRTLSFDESQFADSSGTITVRATNALGTDDWTVAYTFTGGALALYIGGDRVDQAYVGDQRITALYVGTERVM